MAWQTSSIQILRVLINDLDCTPTYDDERLEKVLLVAGYQLKELLDFVNHYTIDINAGTITPDPTDSTTKDDSFVNLMCMKAACIVDRGNASLAAGNALIATEGRSSINLATVAAARQKLLLSGGWCPAYEEAILDYQANSAQTAGAAIMTPFRTMVGYGDSVYGNDVSAFGYGVGLNYYNN